ncbi:hypothetical protein [Candidatus Palauibacter sp.]|uniref:hypothetical protein n=1 Tax=Candidatus Palauibacter sp. TaxID=3101350 RepID=UPI003B024C07
MANQLDSGRARGRMRLLTGALVAVSLLFVTVAEGSHTHGGAADSPAACSICELTHQAGPVVSSATPSVTGLDLAWASVLPGHRLNARLVHLSPHRSRAPPLPISL